MPKSEQKKYSKTIFACEGFGCGKVGKNENRPEFLGKRFWFIFLYKILTVLQRGWIFVNRGRKLPSL